MLHILTSHFSLKETTLFNLYSAEGQGGCGKKKPVKPKDLPSLPSDEDHANPTPLVDVSVITSTPVDLSHAEPPAKKEKKLRQLTVEEEDDMAEWLKMNPYL